MNRAVALWPLLLAAVTVAQDAVPHDATAYDAAMEQIKQRCERLDQKDAAADVKVWTGVIADRRAGTVTVLAAATGIKKTDPLEFYVTPVETGKDYESLAVTPARPSDVDAALRFVGLTSGSPTDPNRNAFWARGPRLTVSYVRGGKTIAGTDAAEDARTGKPVAGELLFAGSYTVTDAQGAKTLAADAIDARPIAPLYEHPAAVLAVPRRAPQSVVYGFQKPTAAAGDWPRGEPVDVVFAPATGAAAVAEWEAFVGVAVVDGQTRYGLRTRPAADQALLVTPGPNDDLKKLFAALGEAADGSRDVWTSVRVADDVPVNDVRKLYAVLQTVEQDRGVKPYAPGKDELYYRGLFPEPQWRDRGKRLGEPWELLLTRENGKLLAKLERSADDPTLPPGSPPVVTSQTVADPVAFVKAVNDRPSKWTRSIFVLPPPDLTYGELMTWVRPVLATYPRVFVFPAEGP